MYTGISVRDRHSGPAERLLYPKLQSDTLGYSVVDRSLYTLSPTDIPVYTLKGYSSYTPGPIDSKVGRKHQGDLADKK